MGNGVAGVRGCWSGGEKLGRFDAPLSRISSNGGYMEADVLSLELGPRIGVLFGCVI